jgi:hypothetical protein
MTFIYKEANIFLGYAVHGQRVIRIFGIQSAQTSNNYGILY